jgi:hypothetical protein
LLSAQGIFFKIKNQKMDTGTIITGAILLAVCILPFLLLGGGKKRKKQLLQSLSQIAEKQNCKITRHELCGDLAIGLDESANCLFFYKKIHDKETAQYAKLSGIRQCKPVSSHRQVNGKDRGHSAPAKFELKLTPVDSAQPDIVLEFFNADDTLQAAGELQVMERWAKIVNERIAK